VPAGVSFAVDAGGGSAVCVVASLTLPPPTNIWVAAEATRGRLSLSMVWVPAFTAFTGVVSIAALRRFTVSWGSVPQSRADVNRRL
jgi:hypothetical protein